MTLKVESSFWHSFPWEFQEELKDWESSQMKSLGTESLTGWGQWNEVIEIDIEITNRSRKFYELFRSQYGFFVLSLKCKNSMGILIQAPHQPPTKLKLLLCTSSSHNRISTHQPCWNSVVFYSSPPVRFLGVWSRSTVRTFFFARWKNKK